ncbi:hypothetical protein VFPPC_01152 [Pochonia chlamydosporia 170]|uniref:Uncharacterized protein n=1 Tax=Pochonia chlamydosporia 170 TaxID=1380566 RepID=A0A179G8F3_METCM|nr:hypothetical protein VFPPC_01152 [Pochonia chlamydosporia 170]OAQ73449.2 hypothetical protein VFPPC_01152 [Pochonia chlamydosporia 170]
MASSQPGQSSSTQRHPASVSEQEGDSGRPDPERESERRRVGRSRDRIHQTERESGRLWGDFSQETPGNHLLSSSQFCFVIPLRTDRRCFPHVYFVAAGRVDYLIYARVYEVNASRQPPSFPSPSRPHQRQERQPNHDRGHTHPLPGMATDLPSPAGDTDHFSTPRPYGPTTRHGRADQTHLHRRPTGSHAISTIPSRQNPSSTQPPHFSVEDQAYLRGRLPIRQPASAPTVINHFRRLPFLYQDLAEACQVRLSDVPIGTREWERRTRMAELAQRLSDKYKRFTLILPWSYIDEAIARWQSEMPHPSRFWDKVLEEVEVCANASWSVVRLWILLFITQSTLVAVAYSMLPTSGKVVLLIANSLAFVWSTTIMCETLHSRYMEKKTDEQALHDLMGGLRG